STPDSYTLSLHDALPICLPGCSRICRSQSCARVICLPGSRLSSYGPPPGSCPRSLWDETPERDGPHSAPPSSHSCVLPGIAPDRSEEHTSELQSRFDLVC